MRRKRSDELPRFVRDAQFRSFQWPRRYYLYLAGIAFILWILFSGRISSDEAESQRLNWSKYAYSLYATDTATLCHAVLVLDALAHYGSKADRVLFYPKKWDTIVSNSKDRESQLLVMARDKYKAKLQPVSLLTVEGRTTEAWTGHWDKSVTKFMAFSLSNYDRVIALDSDIKLLASLDELFQLPPTPIAMPRVYWAESKPWPLLSALMVIQPNLEEFKRFKAVIEQGGNPMLVAAHKFDMEIVNERFEDSALVLPHRPYVLPTSEFRRHNHSAYFGNTFEAWDATVALEEAKLVYFSDWPLPKPWIMWPLQGLAEIQPDCGGTKEGSCDERRIWKELYEGFRKGRSDVCRLLSVPAPEWSSIKDGKHAANVTEGTAHEAPHAGKGHD